MKWKERFKDWWDTCSDSKKFWFVAAIIFYIAALLLVITMVTYSHRFM